jgi:predicted dehydrogenase
MTPFQRTQILGTRGRIEIEIPVNAPPDRPTRIFIDNGGEIRTEEFPVCDQYTLQGDEFSRAIREGGEVPTPLEDSICNMSVIEAVFRSARSGAWEKP